MRNMVHPGAIPQVADLEVVDRACADGADRVVNTAQRLAPKDTGAGAASIHSEQNPSGPGYRVSWDPEHDYMRFHELGTEDMPARPFLRPAVDG